MDLKKEELQNKKCLHKVNNKLNKLQGKILLVLFLIVILLIPEISKRMADFILMIDKETMTLIVRIFLTGTATIATLPVLKRKFEE